MQPFEEVRREVERFAEKLIQWGISPSHEITRKLEQFELEIVQFIINRDRKFLVDVRQLGTKKIAQREGMTASGIRKRRAKLLSVIASMVIKNGT